MSERVDVFKGKRKQRHSIGTILADKDRPPFIGGKRSKPAQGITLRWWGEDHPVSVRLTEKRARDNPRPLARVVIKEELVALTGDHVQALILNQFLYWSSRTRDYDRFLEEERKRDPDANVVPTHGWIYKSAEELTGEIMLSSSPATVRRQISAVVEAGYLDSRNNPRYKWDRCLQYRPNILKIQADLQGMGYPLEGYPLLIEQNPFCTVQNESSTEQLAPGTMQHASATAQKGDYAEENGGFTREDRSAENAQAITENTPENISEITIENTTKKDAVAIVVSSGLDEHAFNYMLEFGIEMGVASDLEIVGLALSRNRSENVYAWVAVARAATNLPRQARFKLAMRRLLDRAPVPISTDVGVSGVPGDLGKMPGDELNSVPVQTEVFPSALVGENPQGAAVDRRKVPVVGSKPLGLNEIWQSVLAELQLQMTRETFNTWLKPTEILSFDEGNPLVVGVENGYVKEWLSNRLLTTIERTVASIVGRAVEVKFVVKPAG